MEQSVIVGVAMFMAGVIYQLGRFSARLEVVEAWKNDLRVELNQIYQELREIKQSVLRGRED